MSFDWPRNVKTCDQFGPAGTFKQLWLEHAKAWRDNRGLQSLLREHWPVEWERVRACRTRWRHKNRKEDGTRVVMGIPCNDKPFCPACNDEATRRRAKAWMAKLVACTPEGIEPTGYLVTIAVSTKEEGHEPVEIVARDPYAFKRAVFEVVQRMYGLRTGTLLSFQAYGEKLLVEEHPHVHAIVHGWRINDDGKPTETPKFEFAGDREPFERIVEDELKRAFPALRAYSRDDLQGPTDVNVKHIKNQTALAYRVKYVARELIDFRKFHYPNHGALKSAGMMEARLPDVHLKSGVVEVENYKSRDKNVLATVEHMKSRLSDYNLRYGGWGKPGRREVDAAYGDLSDTLLPDTVRIMGRHEPHREGCWCKECSTWSRLVDGDTEAKPIGRPCATEPEAPPR